MSALINFDQNYRFSRDQKYTLQFGKKLHLIRLRTVWLTQMRKILRTGWIKT